jgi:hypothetical protein
MEGHSTESCPIYRTLKRQHRVPEWRKFSGATVRFVSMARSRIVLAVCLLTLVCVPIASASFPFRPQGGPGEYDKYFLPLSVPANQLPDDLEGKRVWMYSSTADANSPYTADKRELNGVRGAHLVDANRTVPQGWTVTTGRPDVTVAVTDSGIKWDDEGAMVNIRKKTRISRGETPVPQVDRANATEAGANCASYKAQRDANEDGVFNLVDYACDSRVDPAPAKGVEPKNLLDPQDVLIAFSDGKDDDDNGYVDDMVGWDFLDDDNDPYDDVQYGHGTGESQDSNAEADNGGDLGTCPNCMVIHLRVGTSFVADVNRFAEAVVYATDNDVYVVQDALGTLNKSSFALDAIRYAYDHGTTIVASAADEAAQHHNQPSAMPYSIVVNSVTHDDTAAPAPESYLMFNGCTNFTSRITLAIPSVSCSSDAAGRAAGMAALVYAAAINRAAPHPANGCMRVDGSPCPITPNEVRQVLVAGADDVNFAQTPLGQSTELNCLPVPLPVCTDPFLAAPTARPGTPGLSYPARKGHDQFYGYGRPDMAKTLTAVQQGKLPPEVEVTAPNWFDMVDPGAASLRVDGIVDNRGGAYSCKVYAAAGSYPGTGDFKELTGVSSICNGASRTGRVEGQLATVPMATLKALFPASVSYTGNAGAQTYSGRPNTEPNGFVVKVIATAGALSGQDQRQAFLHRDQDMIDGFPRHFSGDVESSPVLADLDGDNQNELILANSDGEIHAFVRGGGEAPGWPQTTGAIRPHHRIPVNARHEAVLATPAVADLDRDGKPEVVVADLDRRVRVFGADGTLRHTLETNPRYAGIPAEAFVNLRHGIRNRTQPGAIGAPVAGDLDGDGDLEVVLASMDRHVYAWNADGSSVAGFPALMVDRTKVKSIDPVSHQVEFKDPADGDGEQQGAIVDTPAVGDLTGDKKAEIVIGTNEEYPETINAGGADQAVYAPLGAALAPGNSRLFALRPTGIAAADALKLDNSVYLPGWPFKVGLLQRGLLPLVGEGITGSPIIGSVPCNGPTASVRVGTIPGAGLPYIINPDGQSCYGRVNGLDRALPTVGGKASDSPFFAAVGHPAFGTLAGKPSLLAPVAGVLRAVDVVLPEYQGGHDYLGAWDTATGTVAAGWPAEMNDLQFLTGPALADIDGLPGSEVFAGSASDDLAGFSGAGTPLDASWPKLTGDWTVTVPAIGPWGGGESKVLISGTRSGRLMAYDTGAGLCAAADWPQFHHDPANSGDARRDAIPPGHVTQAKVDDRTLSFAATGDDLTCGTATAYEVATSDDAGDTFSGTKVATTSAPKAAGAKETLKLAGALKRYLFLRAADEQGNVGRFVRFDRRTGEVVADGADGPGVAAGSGNEGPGTGNGSGNGCVDHVRPRSRITRARLRSSGGVLVRGRTIEPGCARIRAVKVSVARKGRKAHFRKARGGRRWRFKRTRLLPPGRYVVRVRATDTKGNSEKRSRRNKRTVVVR